MYEAFFGLEREPFSVAPDPQFLYMSAQHREALSHLIYGLRRGGIVLLTGEIGAGKTTVWRCFLEQLPTHYDVAYVVNPKLDVQALLTRLCEELGVERPDDSNAVWDPIDAIHGHVLVSSARGRRTLIVVDEAQALSIDVLEHLRLLTNLDSSDRKLVQVLLIGQPELRTILEKPALEPLAQRVVARFHLSALTEAETRRYIQHRLHVAGLQGRGPFDYEAVARIHRLCGGVPRRINVLCDRSLIRAHAASVHEVDRRFVDQAASDVFGRVKESDLEPAARKRRLPLWLGRTAGAVALLAAAVVVVPAVSPYVEPTVSSLWAALVSPKGRSAAPAPASAASGGPPSAVPASSPAVPPAPGAAEAPADGPAAARQAPLDASLGPLSGTAPLGELEAAFEPGAADEAPAWRALAPLWGVTLAAGEPCAAAAKQSLQCHRTRGGLGAIRDLGRPSIVKLGDERGRVAYVLLTGLGADTAALRLRGVERRVPVALLARAWRGDFATFWRPPPGYREGSVATPGSPLAGWVGERLAAWDGQPAPAADGSGLAARVSAFQAAHGLTPDGVAGARTLLELGRGAGEPRLAPVRPRTSAERGP